MADTTRASQQILIVEDDSIIAKYLTRLLKEFGYNVLDTVISGEEALALVIQTPPDLILMDVHLAGILNGIETASQIRSILDIPIVYLTAHSKDPLLQQAKISGPFGYLIKPVHNRDLYATIEMALHKHQLEIKLSLSEERFRATFDQAAVGISHVAPDGRWLRVNQKLCDIVGYNREELMKRTFHEITYPDDLNTDLEHSRQLLEGGIKTYSTEKRYIRRDGVLIWINLTASLVREPSGEPKYLITVVEDITERKQAEESLQQAYNELETRVVIRTSELAEANKNLRKEIAERKQAERALHDSVDKLKIAYQQATIYAEELTQDIAERKRAQQALRENEEKIRASLQEKEVLLKEIHHRVKNNLQIITSLLYLQSRKIKDQQMLEMFIEAQNRVKSMALVHEKLYQSQDMARVDFAEYIHSLINHLFQSYGVDSQTINLKITMGTVFLGVDTAIPCGLIINELVSNALKYAFPTSVDQFTNQTGEIHIDLQAHEHDQLTLMVSDNGIGLSPEIDFQNTESLGLQLVNNLVKQLDGTIELDQNSGTIFKLTFTVPGYQYDYED